MAMGPRSEPGVPAGARRARSRRRQPPLGDLRFSELFTELFEQANDVVIVNDRDGMIVAANRAARELAGYTLEDVARGVHLREILPPVDFEAAMILTQRAIDGLPFPEMYEREAILRDGQRRAMELRSNVLRREGQAGLLQTIGRDVTEKKAAAAFQAALLQVGQALLTVQSPGEIGRVICAEASRVLGVDGVHLWLRDGPELVGCAGVGPATKEFLGARRPIADSFIGKIYRDGAVFVVNDFTTSPYRNAITISIAVQALLAIPLRRSGDAVGVLTFTDSVNPHCFGAAQSEQASIFGALATVAIEAALAREGEEEEGRVSTALLQVTRAIGESLEEAEVLPQIARSARDVLECDWSVVALWDASKEAFRVATTEGWPPDLAEELSSLELGPGSLRLVNQVLARETVEIAEPRGRFELWTRWQIGSLLAVPMQRAGRVVGALIIGHHERRGGFSARERRIAEGIAAQAAVAVENARLVEALRRANAMKSEFLGMMSHELRTPLNAILGYADLMREGAIGTVDGEQDDALDRILVHGHALLDLITNTLDVNRLEAGRVPLVPTDFTLGELFAEIRSEFAVGAAGHDGVAVHWPVPPAGLRCHTDRSKVKLVLRNLVDNALKFTRVGAVTIALHDPDDPERIRVSVCDTGRGIPPEALSTIFEMFQQVATEAPLPGVGLGLYLVRRYVELMGGTVLVESRVGAGSTFTVDLPRRLPGSA